MASNPPSSGSFLKRQFLGLPVYAWGIGVGVLGLALVFYLRQKSSAASAASSSSPQMPVPTGTSSPTVYPFFMGQTPSTGTSPADANTSSVKFGSIVGKGYPNAFPPNTVPLYAVPGQDPSKPLNQQAVSWAPDKTSFSLTGAPVLGKWGDSMAGFYPVIYQGQQYYLSTADTYPQNVSTGTGGGGFGMHPGTMPAAIV